MSIRVSRKVDTVIIEVDTHTAEKLATLIGNVYDNTTDYGDLSELLVRMWMPNKHDSLNRPAVRYPSPRFAVESNGYTVLADHPDLSRE